MFVLYITTCEEGGDVRVIHKRGGMFVLYITTCEEGWDVRIIHHYV